MKAADSDFFAPEDFPMGEFGERMCRRCMDCAVGVAPYHRPIELPSLNEARFVPEVRSLLSEPSGNGDEAWFCMGGCDENGKHAKGVSLPPSLIGRVKKRGEY